MSDPRLMHDGIALVQGALRDLGYQVVAAKRAIFGVKGRQATLFGRPDRAVGSVVLLPFGVVYRFHVDRLVGRVSERTALALGTNPGLLRSLPSAFEITCAPGEVAAVAAWVPSRIAAQDAGEPLPAPPVPILDVWWWGPGYRWTAAGHELYQATLKRPRFVPCGGGQA